MGATIVFLVMILVSHQDVIFAGNGFSALDIVGSWSLAAITAIPMLLSITTVSNRDGQWWEVF